MCNFQFPYVGFRKAEFMGFLEKVHKVKDMFPDRAVIFPQELVQPFEEEYDGTMSSVYVIVNKIIQAKALEKEEYLQFFKEKEKELEKKQPWWRRG